MTCSPKDSLVRLVGFFDAKFRKFELTKVVHEHANGQVQLVNDFLYMLKGELKDIY